MIQLITENPFSINKRLKPYFESFEEQILNSNNGKDGFQFSILSNKLQDSQDGRRIRAVFSLFDTEVFMRTYGHRYYDSFFGFYLPNSFDSLKSTPVFMIPENYLKKGGIDSIYSLLHIIVAYAMVFTHNFHYYFNEEVYMYNEIIDNELDITRDLINKYSPISAANIKTKKDNVVYMQSIIYSIAAFSLNNSCRNLLRNNYNDGLTSIQNFILDYFDYYVYINKDNNSSINLSTILDLRNDIINETKNLYGVIMDKFNDGDHPYNFTII